MQINQLEERLSKCILEEQHLKSVNMMLRKELSRLQRRRELSCAENNCDTQDELSKKKMEVLAKHSKNMRFLNSKVSNCEETVAKLRHLLDFPQNHNESADKENGEPNTLRVPKSVTEDSTRTQNSQRVYEHIKCEDCTLVMAPFEFFSHLQNGRCPNAQN